jgi:hypothetical protein
MAEDLFEEEKDEAGDDDGENHVPEAECVLLENVAKPFCSPRSTPPGAWC